VRAPPPPPPPPPPLSLLVSAARRDRSTDVIYRRTLVQKTSVARPMAGFDLDRVSTRSDIFIYKRHRPITIADGFLFFVLAESRAFARTADARTLRILLA